MRNLCSSPYIIRAMQLVRDGQSLLHGFSILDTIADDRFNWVEHL
jgi:hypothetical protein